MNKILIYFIIILLSAVPAFAYPQVNDTVHYYEISGNTDWELRQDMNAKGPKTAGRPFSAHTDWNVHWEFDYKSSSAGCRITSVDTIVTITMLMPRWDRSSDDADLVRKWNRFYEALLEHERGHRRFGIQAAEKIERILKMMRNPSCSELERRANETAHKLIEEFGILDDEYDERTENGGKTGAKFF